jgi:hypothetical protein
MSIRSVLSIGLVGAALALGSGARAEDPKSTPAETDEAAQSCAHHVKAMHAMGTDKEREAYCHAHKDCVSHNCGGMGAHEHGAGPIDPPEPKAPAPKK